MALAAWNYLITDDAGNIVTGASIEVRRESDNVLVSLYSDRAGSVSISNPFTDSTGTGRFHVEGSAYKITATKGAFVRTFRFVAIGLGAETDFTGSREVLTANRTYYVRTDGNDSNNGLAGTAGGAFLTIQKAIDICSNALDFGGYTVTVQVADGTYTGAVTMKAMVGMATASSFVIQGNTGTPSNVLIHTTSATAISANGAGVLGTISFLKVQTTTAGLGVTALNRASMRVVSVDFGAVANFQYAATGGGSLFITGNYTISGNATFHMYASTGSLIVAESAGTITLTGTPAFSTFIYAETNSSVRINGNTYSGSATGIRYSSNSNATIFTNGAGASYLPGDSSGSTATGGQYI